MRVLARRPREVYRVYGEEEYLSREERGPLDGIAEPEIHEGVAEPDAQGVRAFARVAPPSLRVRGRRGVAAAGVLIAVVGAAALLVVLDTRPRDRDAAVHSPKATPSGAHVGAPIAPVRPIAGASITSARPTVGARRRPSQARRRKGTAPSPSRSSWQANRVGISHEPGTVEARGEVPGTPVWPSVGEVVGPLPGLDEFGFER